MLKKSVTFSPDDIHIMFEISEDLSGIRDNIEKYNAITDVFTEALESCKEKETSISNEILFGVAATLRDYSMKTVSEMSETCNKYSDLFSKKRDLCLGGGAI